MVALEAGPLVRRGFVVQTGRLLVQENRRNKSCPRWAAAPVHVVGPPAAGLTSDGLTMGGRDVGREGHWAVLSDWPGAGVVVHRPWCRNRRPLAFGHWGLVSDGSNQQRMFWCGCLAVGLKQLVVTAWAPKSR